MTETPQPPVADPTQPVQPSTGMVAPQVEQRADGILDPVFWQGLDVVSQGEVTESLDQPPQNDAEYQAKIEDAGTTGEGAPVISAILVNSGAVTWLTDKPSTSQAHWDGGGSPVNEDLVTEHSVPLGTLDPGTYTVEVLSRDADGNASTGSIQYTVPVAL